MNYEAVAKKKDITVIAREFLKSKYLE